MRLKPTVILLAGMVSLMFMLLFISQNVSGQSTTAATQTSSAVVSTPAVSATPVIHRSDYIFERQPGPDIPTWQEIADGAQTNEEIVQRAVDYFEENRDWLQLLWREDNPVRLAGIYTMYLSHISHVYGETDLPTTLLDFLNQQRAHCGTYTYAQYHLVDALGLTWRVIEAPAEHAWTEILVDGQWEIFDATTNTWLSRSGFELMARVPREFRRFYTPLMDINRPDARLHIAEGYNMQTLRLRMPEMGLFYYPPSELQIDFDNTNWHEVTGE